MSKAQQDYENWHEQTYGGSFPTRVYPMTKEESLRACALYLAISDHSRSKHVGPTTLVETAKRFETYLREGK